MKNFIVTAIIIGVAIIIGCALVPASVIDYAASPGPDHYNEQRFHDGLWTNSLVSGGASTTLTSSSDATTSITAAQACDNNVISWDSSSTDGGASTTFPGTSTLFADCLTADGDALTFLYRNTGATASTTFFVAGSGMDMVKHVGSDATTTPPIAGGDDAWITIIRIGRDSMMGVIQDLIPAD